MSRREDRERQIEGWLEHLQSWKASGQPLLAYARAHGIGPWTMYRWRNVLRREGRWAEGDDGEGGMQRRAAAPDPARLPLRFARVKLSETARCQSLTVRVILRNGRRAEIDLDDAERLSEVLTLLECSA
jgi:hypothetical protein